MESTSGITVDSIAVSPTMTLHLHQWLHPNPRGTLLMVHGKGDYGYRFDDLGSCLQHHGWRSIAPDLRGFGQSPGPRGVMWRYGQYLKDLDIICQQFQPQVLCGYSAGGNWIVTYALQHPQQVKGLILLSPAIQVDTHLNPFTFALLQLINILWPQFVLYRRNNPIKLTSVPEQQQRIREDPSIIGITRVRFVSELIQAGHLCLQQAHRLAIPVLILYSPQDQVADPQGSVDLYTALKQGYSDVTLVPCLNSEHDVMHDQDAPMVLATIQEWLSTRFV